MIFEFNTELKDWMWDTTFAYKKMNQTLGFKVQILIFSLTTLGQCTKHYQNSSNLFIIC